MSFKIVTYSCLMRKLVDYLQVHYLQYLLLVNVSSDFISNIIDL